MSNFEILSAVHGIAPRSDQLLNLGSDLERGRTTQTRYSELLNQETSDWLELQSNASIDIRENGKLDWQDHMRPIVLATNGFANNISNAPVTRWFDTNTFYRQPTINNRLSFNPSQFEEVIGDLGKNISLLTPSSFAVLCNDQYEEFPADRNVFQLYSEITFYLNQIGIERIVFEDYLSDRKERTLQDIEALASWEPNIHFSLLSHSQTSSSIPRYPKANIGIDISKQSLSEIIRSPGYQRPNLSNTEVWQKVVIADNTLNDSIGTWYDHLKAIEILNPFRLVLTHTTDLQHIPLPYAQEKIKKLGHFVSELRSRIGVEK